MSEPFNPGRMLLDLYRNTCPHQAAEEGGIDWTFHDLQYQCSACLEAALVRAYLIGKGHAKEGEPK